MLKFLFQKRQTLLQRSYKNNQYHSKMFAKALFLKIARVSAYVFDHKAYLKFELLNHVSMKYC